MNKLKRALSKIASWGCTLILVFSALAAVGAVFARKPGKVSFIGRYAVVRILTGSMEPAIGAGEYILIEKVPFSGLREGDIVTFYSDDPAIAGRLNTHRIQGFTQAGALVTKGDNNPAPDTFEVTEEKVAGRYVKTLGFLTGVFNIFSQPVGYIALIVLPLLLIMSLSFRDVLAAAKKEKADKDEVTAELERMKESGELEERLARLGDAREKAPPGPSDEENGKKGSE